MIRSKFFSRFIVVTLTAALLLVTGSRAIRVSALAELAPELAPVFDTQIYQLQDYIDHGGMTDPQLDIFYMLCGFYALGQAGSEDYKLTNPYSTQGGVLNWLKDVGVETYNTLIGLAPDTVVLPNGSIQSTDVLKKAASMYVANLMGCALKAVEYDTVEEFEDDIENSDNFYIPWNKSTQYGLNTIFQTYGGIYQWQFDTLPWTSNISYKTFSVSSIVTSQYNDFKSTMFPPLVRHNPTNSAFANGLSCGISYSTYTNLFINTSNSTVYIVDDHGNVIPSDPFTSRPKGMAISIQERNVNNNITYTISSYEETYLPAYSPASYNPNSYTIYRDIVQDVYDGNIDIFLGNFVFLEDFIQHVYVGSSWANRNEIFNIQNLNFDDTGTNYYVTPADDDNYLLDIKGILNDILNQLNLYGVFIDNLFSIDGVPVHDTDLIRITTDIYDLLNQQNPPIPVNLNDIAEYTDNTYLDMVKERATAAGSTLANLVAFWHNCDFELIYVLFGAGITILIGAFIGKWGHS